MERRKCCERPKCPKCKESSDLELVDECTLKTPLGEIVTLEIWKCSSNQCRSSDWEEREVNEYAFLDRKFFRLVEGKGLASH